MFKASQILLLATAVSIVAGCAVQNPYVREDGEMRKSTTYGTIGAIAGAAVGAATSSKKDRTKGALIGAAVGGAAGGGYGYYADKQEAELRRSMQGTGVEVQRNGDDLKLIMPGNITFATNSADISGNFYAPLNNLANSFKQYEQNSIEIIGHTDNVGGAAVQLHIVPAAGPKRCQLPDVSGRQRHADQYSRHGAGSAGGQ